MYVCIFLLTNTRECTRAQRERECERDRVVSITVKNVWCEFTAREDVHTLVIFTDKTVFEVSQIVEKPNFYPIKMKILAVRKMKTLRWSKNSRLLWVKILVFNYDCCLCGSNPSNTVLLDKKVLEILTSSSIETQQRLEANFNIFQERKIKKK